eukprot:403368179
MKRNYTLQNPRNRVNNLMTIQENRSLYERLGSVKSSLDNGAPQKNIHLQLRAKEKINKDIELKTINQSNEILLERMFSIFTRKRPREKGFNELGKPFNKSVYDLKTLNLNLRKQENDKIYRDNSAMLIKLQQAQPKILNKHQWKQHLQNYTQMKRMIRYHGTTDKQSANLQNISNNGGSLNNQTLNSTNGSKFCQFSAGGSKIIYDFNNSAYATASSSGFHKSSSGLYASHNFDKEDQQRLNRHNTTAYASGFNRYLKPGNSKNNTKHFNKNRLLQNAGDQSQKFFNNRSMSIDPALIPNDQTLFEDENRPQTSYMNNTSILRPGTRGNNLAIDHNSNFNNNPKQIGRGIESKFNNTIDYQGVNQQSFYGLDVDEDRTVL